jgi:Lecithin:cholesterol acyltransferase
MTSLGGLVSQPVRRPVSPDAVVVIPGIMGSTLCEGDDVLWGLHRLGWYRQAWRHPESLARLALTPAERGGDYSRVRAAGLLRRPAFAPFLRRIEPYGQLVAAVTDVVADPAAVLEFSYDWRLPVTYNATLLHTAAAAHLDAWRTHSRYQDLLRALPDTRPAQLVLIAHSMGGVLVRALAPGLDIRASITLGTPFDGAAKAALILNTGRGAPVPLPRVALRELAKTLPGLHDLLPAYRCVDDLDHDRDPRRLTPGDVATLGGDLDLATAALAMHADTADNLLTGHYAMIGARQPTPSTITLRDGVVEAHHHTFRLRGGVFDRDAHGVLGRYLEHGDGTVPLQSAQPRAGLRPTPIAQQHGPLASCKEATDAVQALLVERDPNDDRLGDGDIGIDLPDLVDAGTEFAITLTGIDSPTDATVTVYDESGRPVGHPTIHRADGHWQADIGPLPPGIHEVAVAGVGTSPITQLVLVDQP